MSIIPFGGVSLSLPHALLCRFKEAKYFVDAFNVDPIYLRQESGAMPQFRVRLTAP